MENNDEFNLMDWSGQIPLCDDLWLGMQARNIAIVDQTLVRPLESQALRAYFEQDRTPLDLLLPLSALSQMWIFSLYEFLRTWRQRAKTLVQLSHKMRQLSTGDKDDFVRSAVTEAKEKERLVAIAPSFQSEQIAMIGDVEFVDSVQRYLERTEELFRSVESLRVTLAKHEVPKTRGMVAEAPGYARMSYENGSIYWHIILKDGSTDAVTRRSLSNTFLDIAE